MQTEKTAANHLVESLRNPEHKWEFDSGFISSVSNRKGIRLYTGFFMFWTDSPMSTLEADFSIVEKWRIWRALKWRKDFWVVQRLENGQDE